jgi:hypothetical protein
LDNSDIYQCIDELCIDHEKKRTNIEFDKFLNHVNDRFANPTTMEGTTKIFNLIKDQKKVFELDII